MATLREAITSRIDALTKEIANIKADAAAAIIPLQTEIYSEQQKLVAFASWLEDDVDVAQARVNMTIESYASAVQAMQVAPTP